MHFREGASAAFVVSSQAARKVGRGADVDGAGRVSDDVGDCGSWRSRHAALRQRPPSCGRLAGLCPCLQWKARNTPCFGGLPLLGGSGASRARAEQPGATRRRSRAWRGLRASRERSDAPLMRCGGGVPRCSRLARCAGLWVMLPDVAGDRRRSFLSAEDLGRGSSCVVFRALPVGAARLPAEVTAGFLPGAFPGFCEPRELLHLARARCSARCSAWLRQSWRSLWPGSEANSSIPGPIFHLQIHNKN